MTSAAASGCLQTAWQKRCTQVWLLLLPVLLLLQPALVLPARLLLPVLLLAPGQQALLARGS